MEDLSGAIFTRPLTSSAGDGLTPFGIDAADTTVSLLRGVFRIPAFYDYDEKLVFHDAWPRAQGAFPAAGDCRQTSSSSV